MRRRNFSRKSPVLLCALVLCLLVLAGCGGAEGGFSWKLWGFETQSYTVDGERIDMRLDTSGFGKYETELQEDTIYIIRDGETILEGYFTPDSYEDLEQEALSDPELRTVARTEGPPASLLLYFDGDGGEYLFLAQVEDAPGGAVFWMSGEISEEEAMDRAGRLRFIGRAG